MSAERTEPATPKRRKKARDEGQVARSSELVSGAVLLGLLSGAHATLPHLADGAIGFFFECFAAMSRRPDPEGLASLAGSSLRVAGTLSLAPMAAAAGLGFAASVPQVGLRFSSKLLEPRANRLDLLQGIKRMASPKSAVEILKGLVKVAVVAFAGWSFVRGHWEDCFRLLGDSPRDLSVRVGELAYGLSMRMVTALTGVALLDYAYQRWQFEQSIKMTKQEVRDEMREAEGNPETRGRIRQRQREFSRRRMMADVPTATVVITNPTHFAVALRYQSGQGGAPKVVAKGQDQVALRIRALAGESGVPIVENPPLARALHAQVKIGDEIPAELYRAVAEVLAVILRLDRQERAR